MNVLINKNILIISPEKWDVNFVSKHHYATNLAKSNNIFFLNPPSKSESYEFVEEFNVGLINYTGFISGLRFMPSFLQRIIIKRKFRFIEKLVGAQIDVVWSFDNSVFFDFSAINNRAFTICHIVDLNMDFEFERSARSAHVCFGTTNFLLEKMKSFNDSSFKIGHGFAEGTSIDFSIMGTFKLNVGYVGNLSIKYLDWSIVDEITNKHTQIGFHFVGPYASDKLDKLQKKVFERENVFIYGKRTSEECSSFLIKMDCLLLCYNSEEYLEQLAFPHKLMEYLGSGREIVATYTDEFNGTELFEMVKSSLLFAEKFDSVMKDIGFYNSVERVSRRKEFAKANSYQCQIRKIEQIISTL